MSLSFVAGGADGGRFFVFVSQAIVTGVYVAILLDTAYRPPESARGSLASHSIASSRAAGR